MIPELFATPVIEAFPAWFAILLAIMFFASFCRR